MTAAIKLRNQNKDTFRKQNGYNWDYVIVLKVYKHDEKLIKMQDRFSFKKILLGMDSRMLWWFSFWTAALGFLFKTKVFFDSVLSAMRCLSIFAPP